MIAGGHCLHGIHSGPLPAQQAVQGQGVCAGQSGHDSWAGRLWNPAHWRWGECLELQELFSLFLVQDDCFPGKRSAKAARMKRSDNLRQYPLGQRTILGNTHEGGHVQVMESILTCGHYVARSQQVTRLKVRLQCAKITTLCVCVCVRVHTHVRVCMHACVYVCVSICLSVCLS